VFYTDGDGQYDVHDLSRLLELVSPEVVLVNGYKTARQDPRHRIWIGAAYNWFARRLFRVRLRDIDCDFRLIRRKHIGGAPLLSTGGAVCVELVKRLEDTGAKIMEIPVGHYPRLHGRSQFFRVRSLAVTFFELFQFYWLSIARPWLHGKFNSTELRSNSSAGLHGD
jgi:hypothetical protein